MKLQRLEPLVSIELLESYDHKSISRLVSRTVFTFTCESWTRCVIQGQGISRANLNFHGDHLWLGSQIGDSFMGACVGPVGHTGPNIG